MTCDYTIDVAQRLVRITVAGEVTPDVLRDLRRRIFEDPAFDPDGAELFDLSRATLSTVTIDEVKSGVKQFRTQRFSARRAFVASDSATFGTVRMYLTLRELAGDRSATGVFKTIGEAESWLGV